MIYLSNFEFLFSFQQHSRILKLRMIGCNTGSTLIIACHSILHLVNIRRNDLEILNVLHKWYLFTLILFLYFFRP